MKLRKKIENTIKFGIPCSKIKEKITDVEVFCTSEEEAMALAAGAWLAGKKPVVYMQNNGLCRALDIIFSLYKPYDIPLPKLILSIRHKPAHHYFVGKETKRILEMIDWKEVEIVEEN
jgi:phosphonopyruvate decarboxylase